jgi:hypothetical protein
MAYLADCKRADEDKGKHGIGRAICCPPTKILGILYLTNPKIEYNPENELNIKDKRSFLTAWISEEMGIYLGKRGRLLDYFSHPSITILIMWIVRTGKHQCSYHNLIQLSYSTSPFLPPKYSCLCTQNSIL